MKTITLVTGNEHKLEEWRQQWPLDTELSSRNLELTEVQGTSEHIVTEKVKQAFSVVGTPVIVEDVAAGLDRLNGFPGPYIKDLIQRLKEAEDLDARDGLFAIVKGSGEAATAHCVAAYYDGEQLLIATGTVHGTAVEARGERGFGFDFSFIPLGETRTYAEMSPEEKAQTSHRARAIKLLAKQIAAL
jgi:non-canonical purine NTP pyrophosphatase (RdgB/HAM1 family)